MKKLTLKLKGISPLLMNRPDIIKMWKDQEESAKNTGKKRKDRPTREEEARMKRYLLPDGNFCVEAKAVMRCIQITGRLFTVNPIEGIDENGNPVMSPKKVRADNYLGPALIITDPVFPLMRNGKPINGEDYEIYDDIAPIPSSGFGKPKGGCTPTARPKINLPWELTCTFLYDDGLLWNAEEKLKEIIKHAGIVTGLLSYRPACGGYFGKFACESIVFSDLE
jgi:hypothetical protein